MTREINMPDTSVKDFYERRYRLDVSELNDHQVARLAVIDAYVALSTQEVGRPVRLLDVGCGNGWLAQCLTRYGAVWGVDLSDEAVCQARRRVPSGTFEAADFLQNPPPWPSFDIVVCSEVIEHLLEQDRAVRHLAKLTRPGGSLVLTTPNGGKASPGDYPAERLQPVERWLTPTALRDLLSPDFAVRRSTSVYLGHRDMACTD